MRLFNEERLSSEFEIAVLVVIGLLIQALIFASGANRQVFNSFPSVN